MNLEILKEAGLTHNEALVYKALLELGPSLAGQISRKTGLHRRTVYDVTEMLIKKGVIGYILKNNRRLFEASSPKIFLDVVKEKENTINYCNLPKAIECPHIGFIKKLLMRFYTRENMLLPAGKTGKEISASYGLPELMALFQEQIYLTADLSTR